MSLPCLLPLLSFSRPATSLQKPNKPLPVHSCEAVTWKTPRLISDLFSPHDFVHGLPCHLYEALLFYCISKSSQIHHHHKWETLWPWTELHSHTAFPFPHPHSPSVFYSESWRAFGLCSQFLGGVVDELIGAALAPKSYGLPSFRENSWDPLTLIGI